MRLFLISFLVCLASTNARAESSMAGTGLQIAAVGDIVGTFGHNVNNRLEPREAELVFYAPVDQIFDAQSTLAAHRENGEMTFEVHELYIGSSRLIPRSRFRVGQFFLGFGRLNQFHRHDWPFTTAPKVQREFFDKEGVFDSGAEYSFLFPIPFYLDLTVGVTNGWVFGHTHNDGSKPHVPTHYARLINFQSFGATSGMQIGLNYVGRRDDKSTTTSYFGLDVNAKWREAQTLTFLLQSELWMRTISPVGGDSEKSVGFYLYPQYGFDSFLQFGVRFDGFTVTSLKDASGAKIGNFDYAIVPTLTYKASEFSTIRLSYSDTGSIFRGSFGNRQSFFELQGLFLLGAHPAHDF